jgi:ribonuclease J
MTRNFIDRAKAAKPHILVIEGTNIASGRVSTETEVLEKSLKVIKEATGLVMASFSPVDLDRLVTFYQAAIESGRKLAISTKQAFLLESLGNEVRFNPLSANQGDVLIFARQKQRYRIWEKLVLSKSKNVIEAGKISRLQDKLVLVYSFYDMNEMGEIRPKPGSVFILSQSEPFTEEMEIDHSRLLNWLDYYGVPLYNIHASGHATPHELKEVIAEIAPEKVFLIHTERPVLFAHFLADLPVEAITPQLGETYHFG